MLRKHVLLVEDDLNFGSLLCRVLQRAGYNVDVAASMAEAKEFLTLTQYAVVIADWRLSDGDGTVILGWASQLGAKTALMSAYLLQMPGGRSFDHETLTKPIPPQEVVALVQRAIGTPTAFST